MRAITRLIAIALMLGGCASQTTGGKDEPPPLTLDGKADFRGAR